MAIFSKKITGTAVVVLTAAGELGTGWMDENDLDAAGEADIRILHTPGAAPNAATIRLLGKRIYKPIGNKDIMELGVDSASDIYYAICFNIGDVGTLILDVV